MSHGLLWTYFANSEDFTLTNLVKMKTSYSSLFSYCMGYSGLHCILLRPQTLVDSSVVDTASTIWLWLLEMLLCESWMCDTGCCCKEEDFNEKKFLHNIVQYPGKTILVLLFSFVNVVI
jgi:hypothetical protein